MIQEINHIVSQYYPKLVYSFSEEYEKSKEHRLLNDRILFYQNDNSFRQTLTSYLDKICEGTSLLVEDETKFNYLDRCFSFEIKNHPSSKLANDEVLIVCISILGPYYCCYSRDVRVIRGREGDFIGFNNSELFDDLPSSDNEIMDRLRTMLKTLNFIELGKDVLFAPLNKYSFYGIPFEDFNCFTALFKDAP